MAIQQYSGVAKFQASLAASGKPYKGSTEMRDFGGNDSSQNSFTKHNPSIISEYTYNMDTEKFKQIQQKIAASRQPTTFKDNTGDSTALKVTTT